MNSKWKLLRRYGSWWLTNKFLLPVKEKDLLGGRSRLEKNDWFDSEPMELGVSMSSAPQKIREVALKVKKKDKVRWTPTALEWRSDSWNQQQGPRARNSPRVGSECFERHHPISDSACFHSSLGKFASMLQTLIGLHPMLQTLIGLYPKTGQKRLRPWREQIEANEDQCSCWSQYRTWLFSSPFYSLPPPIVLAQPDT